eukprot:scaffold193_cov255-Pinguiococcus_pyrenoidosus.AAC.14
MSPLHAIVAPRISSTIASERFMYGLHIEARPLPPLGRILHLLLPRVDRAGDRQVEAQLRAAEAVALPPLRALVHQRDTLQLSPGTVPLGPVVPLVAQLSCGANVRVLGGAGGQEVQGAARVLLDLGIRGCERGRWIILLLHDQLGRVVVEENRVVLADLHVEDAGAQPQLLPELVVGQSSRHATLPWHHGALVVRVLDDCLSGLVLLHNRSDLGLRPPGHEGRQGPLQIRLHEEVCLVLALVLQRGLGHHPLEQLCDDARLASGRGGLAVGRVRRRPSRSLAIRVKHAQLTEPLVQRVGHQASQQLQVILRRSHHPLLVLLGRADGTADPKPGGVSGTLVHADAQQNTGATVRTGAVVALGRLQLYPAVPHGHGVGLRQHIGLQTGLVERPEALLLLDLHPQAIALERRFVAQFSLQASVGHTGYPALLHDRSVALHGVEKRAERRHIRQNHGEELRRRGQRHRQNDGAAVLRKPLKRDAFVRS